MKSENIIELKDVNKHYKLGKTKIHALTGANLKVQKGEFIVVKGASGSGKTTTLNIMGAMDVPTSGEVEIVGKRFSQMNDFQLSQLRRNHIGFIFQSFNLIPVLSALENVEYPLNLIAEKNVREKALEIMEQVGLQDFIKHKPNELSGGQIQRVAIARALVTLPDIVLADEPTANLDSKTSQQILELIVRLQKQHKLTFIVSSHHQFLIENAERILECHDGKIFDAVESPGKERLSQVA